MFLCRVLFGLILSAGIAFGADGKSLYKRHCANCHGKNGEGVKGKYDDALHGTRTLDRLARYIDKNMPEENPDKLNAAQSEAVAKYIYDLFYSEEARIKKNPPRVELTRLTNPQYLTTVSDLIGRFTGAEWKVGKGEHGLEGVYYDSRNFAREKVVTRRTDREIKFDYGTGGPEKMTTNEFSIQWRGSIIAPDTGVYEFFVRTPQGIRLWVNDEQEPLIDAWVSSRELMEHRATIKLIGGRAYPLRLDCFRFKDKQSSIELLWKPPHGPRQVVPSQVLRTDRAATAFVLRTQFPADDSSVGYERGVSVSKEWNEAGTRAALEVAAHVVKNLDRFSRAKVGETNRTAKVEEFCAKFVEAAFRRPLTVDEKKVYFAQHFKGVEKIEESVKRVVLLALKSPHFLYLGIDDKKPDDFEIASRLSYALWDSMPDTELLKAAAEGKLRARTDVEAQARRMLNDPRAQAKMRGFFSHWLELERGDDLLKDATLFPDFTPEIAADLRTSLQLFLDDVVWSEKSDYRRLLLADELFVNDRLAQFYGIEHNSTNDFIRIRLDPKQRAGVITHPFLLSALAYNKTTSPIHRGVFLTKNIVGRALKPPPTAVAFNDDEFSPNLTMREKITQLTKPNNCQGCHSVINPLGFSLENFDAVGRFRTDENGKTIDAVSEYLSEDGETVKLAGPRDVAEYAANSRDAQEAFVEQLFHHLVKQPVRAYGSDIESRLREKFVASNFNIKQLMVEIATVSSLSDSSKKIAAGGR